MVEPHTCAYGDDCRHEVTLEQWAVAHPDEARRMLAALQPDTAAAQRIRGAIEETA